jgi:hypothetical protein
MDILAHALWVGVGLGLARRHYALTRRTAVATVVLAVLPDVLHLLPIWGWWVFGDGSWAALRAYAIAVPGQEPPLSPLVQMVSHHLHCIMHSAVVAGGVTLVLWRARQALWVPLLGWWSHIVIDLFTHSAEFYPVAVLYPVSDWAFDGLAWNTPWFMVANYVALAVAAVWLVTQPKSNKR